MSTATTKAKNFKVESCKLSIDDIRFWIQVGSICPPISVWKKVEKAYDKIVSNHLIPSIEWVPGQIIISGHSKDEQIQKDSATCQAKPQKQKKKKSK